MSDATATILAALIGFLGGLIFAAYTFRQKADELFWAGLSYLEGGSQKRNLGIAAMELAWGSRRHRKVIAPLLANVAVYLLLESGQKDAQHEIVNLRRIMALLTNADGRAALSVQDKAGLVEALKEKRKHPESGPGLLVTESDLDNWIAQME